MVRIIVQAGRCKGMDQCRVGFDKILVLDRSWMCEKASTRDRTIILPCLDTP